MGRGFAAAVLAAALVCAGCGTDGGAPKPSGQATTADTARSWTGDELTRALVTSDDLPGDHVQLLIEPTNVVKLTVTAKANSIGSCLKFYATGTELGSDVVPGQVATETVDSPAPEQPPLRSVVTLRGYPSADQAASKIKDLRDGMASCDKAEALPDPRLGDGSAAFTEVIGTYARASVVARVGAATVSVQASRDHSGKYDLKALTELATTIAAKQVAKLKAA